MWTFALMMLLAAQDAAPAEPVKLVVPAGPCQPAIDGAAGTLETLRTATGQWAATHREVRFEPDAKADPACMQAVLKILGAAGAGERFPIGFVENEAFSGVEGD
ncbi:hypothetical protein ACBY01_08560 [Sphingomonas sp. ac-8]|uniref:hypothetical protein n=1 Tax=Sphingomonas sp. ac-8 TaxID=3242977 RepID=UPI003A81184C